MKKYIEFYGNELDILKTINALNTLKNFELDITPAYEELNEYEKEDLQSTLDKLKALRNKDKAELDESQKGIFELSYYGIVDYIFTIQDLMERLEESEEE